jgi:hypothetical protein
VALHFRGAPDLTAADNIAKFVKARVDQYNKGMLPAGLEFPLANASTDTVRQVGGLCNNVVAAWLDPLTWKNDKDAPRFGASTDLTVYFGDGWKDWSQWAGKGNAGWIWTNHEYVSNDNATATSAPTGQHLTLARFLRGLGVLDNDVDSPTWAQGSIDALVRNVRKNTGGAWFKVIQDGGTGLWTIDRNAKNLRYDATSATLSKITGYALSAPDWKDDGTALPAQVVTGTGNNCAGTMTPWGTVITGEENVQSYYGDFEAAWDGNQKFLAGMGFDPGANVAPKYEPAVSGESRYASAEWSKTSVASERYRLDTLGWLAEWDPGQAPDEYEGKTMPGVGRKNLGAMGRARWEGATFVVGSDWKLVLGQPIVVYAGDDRRGGRVHKFVTKGTYTAGMTRAQIRALLDEGKLYVAHFAGLDPVTGQTLRGAAADVRTVGEATPGSGRWIELSTTSTDDALNAMALGAPGKKVGEALKDPAWNGIGAFATDDQVKSALFTAGNRSGSPS